MNKLEHFVEAALEGGADRAVLMDASQVVVDDRVRLKCRIPICKNYNRCLMCPPNTYTVAEFRGLLAQYSQALLLQIKAKGKSEVDIIDTELQVQNLVSDLETKALMEGNYFVAGLGAAHCRLCPECVGVQSDEECRHPFRARPSMEAVGIDVYKTSANGGIPVDLLDPENLYFAGLLLLC